VQVPIRRRGEFFDSNGPAPDTILAALRYAKSLLCNARDRATSRRPCCCGKVGAQTVERRWIARAPAPKRLFSAVIPRGFRGDKIALA